MSDGGRNLLESVIHITGDRDKKSLEKVLVKTLHDFIDCDALVLFRVIGGEDGELLEEAASVPEGACQNRFDIVPHEYGAQLVKRDEAVIKCIQKGEVISEAGKGERRVLFRIVINGEVSGILVIFGGQFSETTETLIHYFLRIHSNFLTIIDDNEHDTLTGLLNRKTFDSRISDLLSSISQQNKPLSPSGAERRNMNGCKSHWLGVLDIDHFKSINDNFGHVYGDEVLLLFSGLMKKTFRNGDLLFRYGGEEFVVVLAHVTESKAYMVFERFRQKLEQFEFPQIGQVTVCTGMVKIAAQDHPSTVVEHADKALYYAKQQGRNQTHNYNELLKSGVLQERNTAGDIELF